MNGLVCDLIEAFHDLMARPSRRWHHEHPACWHYSDFATAPGRRLYRWRINRLLASSTLGLRLADSGEDLGRLVRVEPTGLEDLPERAVEAAAPEAVDWVQHAIALFRARAATVEERRSAVITLAGILEERRDLLRAELLTKDETALFQIANKLVPRHRPADRPAPRPTGAGVGLVGRPPAVVAGDRPDVDYRVLPSPPAGHGRTTSSAVA